MFELRSTTTEQRRQRLYERLTKLMTRYIRMSEGDYVKIHLSFKQEGYMNNVTIGIIENKEL